MIDNYDKNIFQLIQENDNNKIIVTKDSWAKGAWAIVNKIIKKNDVYGVAVGHINFANGNKENGIIEGANLYKWKLLKSFNEKVKIE